jgi:hypothetical protein
MNKPDYSKDLGRFATLQVSMVANAASTETKSARLADVLAAIQGGRWRTQIEAVRRANSEQGKAAADALKKFLPAILFSGLFARRCKDGLLRHDGVLCVDCDNLNGELADARQRIEADMHTLATFLSPRGNGLKVLVPIEADAARHEASFLAAQSYFRERFGLAIDPACKDVSRLAFVSHDPALYLNPGATLLPPLADEVPAPVAPSPALSSTCEQYVRAALERECGAVATVPEGQRNARLNEAAFNLGQLAGAGALAPTDAKTALEAAARACGLPEREAARTIQSGLDAGAKQPRQIPARPRVTLGVGGARAGTVAEPVEIEAAAAYQAFPADALPEPHRSLVTHGAEAIGCDPALVALPLLAATAGAIGNARRIQLKRGWCEPCVLWAVTVALSGDRKSPAFELGTDGLQQIEDRAFAELRAAQAEHKKALAAWRDAGASGEKPEAPTARRLIVRDVTVQSVAMVLAENLRGVTLARDELAAWVGGFDRFTGGKGEEAAHWLEMHRAGKVTADRKTGEPKTVHVPRAAVSVTGTIQPGTLERILERRFFENGLAARLLLAWPPRQLRTWSEGELDETILRPVREVFAKLTSLPMGADGFGNPQPVDLPLTPEAKARWIQFYDEHAAESHGLGDERLGSAWSKLEGATARFALVVHGIRAANGDKTLADSAAVDLASIEVGIRLTNWFKGETRRIYGRLVESEDTRDCRRVMECALAKGGRVTVRDVAKAGVCQGDPERITAAMDRLAAAGRGAWRDVPATERGGRPTRSFELSGETGETVSGAGLASEQPPAKPAKPGTAGEVSPVMGVSGMRSEVENQVSPVSPAEPQPAIEEGEL